MPQILRPALTCFYCGSKSTQKFTPGLRAWHCGQCEAANYLDENGQITDPPVTANSSQARYAQPVERSTSPDLLPEDSIFCSTCIKNQHLLNEALANYLPAPDNPKYTEYERGLPAYRRRLEEDYPQVCYNCEPKARERLRQAGYVAKSDHLRRLMQRTKARRVASRWGWRRILVATGSIAFWTSIAGQIIWHLMSATPKKGTLHVSSHAHNISAFPECALQYLRDGEVASECSRSLESSAGFSLVLGIISIWWNPRWTLKLQGQQGRLVGLTDYYKSQVTLLAFRFLAYLLLQDEPPTYLDASNIRAVHLVVAAVMVLSTMWSRWLVKLDTTPLISWKDIDEPLLPPLPEQHHHKSTPFATTHQNLENGASGMQKAFPLSLLAPEPSRLPNAPAARLPTPPQDDDPEAMDWESTRTPLKIDRPPPLPLNEPQPSPFHGRLPVLPTNQRLLPETQKANRPGISPGFFNKPLSPAALTDTRAHTNGRSPLEQQPVLVEPKFFPASDFQADTGLETLFTKVFSMKEDPPEILQTEPDALVPRSSRANTSDFAQSPHIDIGHMMSACLLGSCLFIWLLLEHFWLLPAAKLAMVSTAGLVPMLSLSGFLKPSAVAGMLGEKHLFVLESIAALAIGTHHWQESPDHRGKCDLLAKALLACMAFQNLYLAMTFGNHRASPQSKTVSGTEDQRSPESEGLASQGFSLQDHYGRESNRQAAGTASTTARDANAHTSSRKSHAREENLQFGLSNLSASQTRSGNIASTTRNGGFPATSPNPNVSLGGLSLTSRSPRHQP